MTNQFKIEKGVPLPILKVLFRFPLLEMEVNDSFKIDVNEEGNLKKAMGRIHAAISYARRMGYIKDKKFTTRNIDNKYVRCWRIK